MAEFDSQLKDYVEELDVGLVGGSIFSLDARSVDQLEHPATPPRLGGQILFKAWSLSRTPGAP